MIRNLASTLLWLLVAGIATANENAKCVPFCEFVTTSPQAGLRYFNDVFPQDTPDGKSPIAHDFLRELNSLTIGPSNVILVDATNPQDAVRATIDAFRGGRSADVPITINQPDPESGNFWLVAFIGLGPSQPTWWIVDNVMIEDGTIRLDHRRAEAKVVSSDVHPYYYWVPLGKLASGSYRIELFDTSRGKPTITRTVDVK